MPDHETEMCFCAACRTVTVAEVYVRIEWIRAQLEGVPPPATPPAAPPPAPPKYQEGPW